MPEPIQEPAPIGPDTATPPGRDSERDRGADDGAPPPEKTCAHEALLVRHGLISHVAELEEGTPDATATEFLRDVSRLAKNTIRLSPNRFGLLLGDDPPAGLSAVAHRVTPIAAAGTGPSGSDPEPLAAPDPLFVGAGASDPGAVAGIAIAATPPGAAPALSPDALTAMLGTLLDASLEKHLAPIAQANAELREERSRWHEDVAQFWEGMEAVLRMMNETAARLVEAETASAADRMSPAMTREDAAALRSTLADLETTMAIGFEASGAVQEASHAELKGHLAGLHEDRPLTRAEVSEELAPLSDAMRALQGGTNDAGSAIAALQTAVAAVPDKLESLRASVDGLGEDLANDDEAGQSLAALRAIESRLSDLVSEVSDNARTQGGAADRLLDEVERLRGAMHAAGAAQDALARIESLLHGMNDSLAGRGGILSEAVETSCRSMKNFWLASEDTLQRLQAAIEGVPAQDREGEAAAMGGLLGRLGDLETALAEGERRAALARHVLAEVLALQLKSAAAGNPKA